MIVILDTLSEHSSYELLSDVGRNSRRTRLLCNIWWYCRAYRRW